MSGHLFGIERVSTNFDVYKRSQKKRYCEKRKDTAKKEKILRKKKRYCEQNISSPVYQN